ncbi:MAG: 30S ribosomal protein S13 [Candidatus Altiarchaeota archaeon]|nr:30S ribosomal protein S13 [Candidatus Altiarchaeota archaeon]
MAENSKNQKKVEMRHLVRIASSEIKGELPTKLALTHIKGIGDVMADAVMKVLNLEPTHTFGMLDDAEIERIEKCVLDPRGHGIPLHLLNARKNTITGTDTHFVGPELIIHKKQVLDKMKKTKSYKGMRHAYGLKVRGQKTKSTGRRGKAMGVSRKKIKK